MRRPGVDPAPESQEVMSMKAIFEGFSKKITEDALMEFWLNKPEAPELNGNAVTEEELLAELGPNMNAHIRENLALYDDIFHESADTGVAFERIVKLILSEARGRAKLIYDKLVALKSAGTDPLTGLPNRKVFKHNLNVGIQRNMRLGETFSVIFFDLDHFKGINDTYGHDAGDKVLQEMARRLTRDTGNPGGLRKLDVVVRFGGEEFVLLLPTTPKEGACIVAQRISEKISSKPFKIANNGGEPLEIKVTASIGVSEYTNAEEDPDAEEMLRRADASLYVLKGKTPDNDGIIANRRGQIACDNRVITAADIESYKEMLPDRRSGLPTPTPIRVDTL